MAQRKSMLQFLLGVQYFFSFFIVYFRTSALSFALANSFILFVFSATFTFCIIRFVLINSWEKREKKIVMQEWNKFYVIPYPPQDYPAVAF